MQLYIHLVAISSNRYIPLLFYALLLLLLLLLYKWSRELSNEIKPFCQKIYFHPCLPYNNKCYTLGYLYVWKFVCERHIEYKLHSIHKEAKYNPIRKDIYKWYKYREIYHLEWWCKKKIFFRKSKYSSNYIFTYLLCALCAYWCLY